MRAPKGKAIPLKVSAPFHCALMAPAARSSSASSRPSRSAPRFPIVANVDAQPNVDPVRVKELLVRQVDGAVRWEQAVRFMVEHGVTHALEMARARSSPGSASASQRSSRC